MSDGAIRVDQRVRVADPGKDYMTTWEAWLDVQNGADFRGLVADCGWGMGQKALFAFAVHDPRHVREFRTVLRDPI